MKIIGIDLGTSNSAAAVMEGGKAVIIPSAEGMSVGGKAFPSVVAFTKDAQLLVGEPARRQAITNPEGTIMAAKRKMGSDFKYQIFGKEYTPQQISAFILQKIKRDAEAFLGTKVEKAVVTVPAYFNDNQRQATKDAGTIAGLEVVRIINEPTAASLAYGLDKNDKEQRILVFDLGGGTLDVTIMDFGQNVFEVKSTSGDTQLGGTDMDNALIEFLATEFKKTNGIDLRFDGTAMQRLREASEKAKIELSTVVQTQVNLPFIAQKDSQPLHLSINLSRAKLEELIRPIIERCRMPIVQALTDAKMEPKDVDRIVLVGGPTRMPMVQQFLESIFGKKVERGVDPMECVAIGAAIQGAVLNNEDVGTDLPLLLDVTPLSLGIETLGGVFTKVMDRNTTIPTKRSQVFSTAADGQTSVEINVLQGERSMASDNVSLGRFSLVGIPPAPRGVPQVEVTFDIDANGILHVSAKDLGTGKEQKIQIVSPHKLDKREIDEMMKQAEKFAEQDKKKQEEAVARNDGDAMVYAAEKFLTDYADKLKQEDKEKIQSLAGELKQALSGSDSLAVKQKLDALKKEMQRVGSEFYKKGRGESAGGSGPGDSGGNDFAGGNFGFESPGSGGNQGNGAKDAEFREK